MLNYVKGFRKINKQEMFTLFSLKYLGYQVCDSGPKEGRVHTISLAENQTTFKKTYYFHLEN